MSMSSRKKTTRLAAAALLAALAIVFSYIEAMIPNPAAIPGVKLGIANIVILVALYELDLRYALAINIIRITIVGLLFSGLFGALYSLAGGLLSMLVMWLLQKTGLFSIVGVSMAGGVCHNIGQLLTASFIVCDLRMFMYLPVLMFSGIISGILVGFISWYICRTIKKEVLHA